MTTVDDASRPPAVRVGAGAGAVRAGHRGTDASGRIQPVEAPWNRGGFANNLVQRVEVVVLAE